MSQFIMMKCTWNFFYHIGLLGIFSGKVNDGMYSDTSSTTASSENSENFPGNRQITLAHYHSTHAHVMGQPSAKLQQQYKGQLKLAVYVNYGLITVHVVMGRHLKSKSRNNCNSYVKLAITPDESKRTRCKTDIHPDSNNPLFDEKFSFELVEGDIDKRLFVSLWNRDTSRNQCEFLGCMSFGIRHIYNQSKTVSGWYYLLPGDVGKRKHLQVHEGRAGALTDRQNRHPGGPPPISPDMLWADMHTLVVKRSQRGYGFTISGVAPVCVRRLEAGSYAEKVGLRGGDQILKIDGINVANSNADSVARIIKHSVRQVVLEVSRPRQLDPVPLSSLDRSPRKLVCHSTPERRYEAMEMDLSPWRRGLRHKPYPQPLPPPLHQPYPAAMPPPQPPSAQSHPFSSIKSTGSIDEPIYEEPDFGVRSMEGDTSFSPGVKHHDYGWVDFGEKENYDAAATEISDRYSHIPHSVDGKFHMRGQIDEFYVNMNNENSQAEKFSSGTLPRGMKFKTSSRTKLQTYASSDSVRPRETVPLRRSASTKDYGWIDGSTYPAPHTDYSGSQSSGYGSTSASLKKRVSFKSLTTNV